MSNNNNRTLKILVGVTALTLAVLMIFAVAISLDRPEPPA